MSTWHDILAPRAERPELLGVELESFPFISGFGIAFRVCRLSCLEVKDLFPVLGIRASTDLNLLQACHRPGASRTRFEERVGLDRTQVPAYWNVSAWSPLDLHGHWHNEELPLRHCPQCAPYGYHSSLFQLPSIERCPWHGCPLRACCEQCGLPYSSRSTAELDLGRCACGLDLFDSDAAGTMMWHFPHAQAFDKLRDYLAWATTERRRRHFLAPQNETLAQAGFAELARPPMDWNKVAERRKTEIITYSAPESSVPSAGEFWGWCLLGSDRPLTLTRLSASTHRRLVEVSRHRIGQPTCQISGAAVVEKFIPPVDVVPGVDRWVRLSAVDPRALHTCACLTEAVCEYIGDIDERDICRSPVVQKSNAMDGIAGRGALHRALEDVLVTGFEQGMDALCSVHLKQPSQIREWVAPVAEIAGQKGQLEEVRIGWLTASSLVAEPTPEMKTTRKARTKKTKRARGGRRSVCRVSGKRKAERKV